MIVMCATNNVNVGGFRCWKHTVASTSREQNTADLLQLQAKLLDVVACGAKIRLILHKKVVVSAR